MSTAEFQKAIAYLVRSPHLLDKPESLDIYDLNASEKKQLNSVMLSKFFRSYANSEQQKRFGLYIKSVFKNTRLFLGEELISLIFFDHFDYEHAHIAEDDLSFEFNQFLNLENKKFFKTEDWPIIKDLLEYDLSEFLIMGGRIDHKWSVSQYSLLNPDVPFLCNSFQTDISEIVEILQHGTRPNSSNKDEWQRDCFFLFVREESEEGESLSQYEVNYDLHQFLETEKSRTEPYDSKTALPVFYSDLVDLGLCKNYL